MGGAGVGSGPGANLLARLPGLRTEWEALSGEARHARITGVRAAGADPEEAVLALLAHAVVCWKEGEPSACAAALAEARAAAGERAELREAVETLEAQFAHALAGSNPVVQHLNAAMAHLREGRAAEALPLLETAGAAAREAGDGTALAAVLFYLGQARLGLDQPVEAVTVLQEALDLAAESADDEVQQAIRQVLTVAVQAAAGSSATNPQGDTP